MAAKKKEGGVERSWRRIESWFADRHPEVALGLAKGASEKSIAAAEKKLGARFPPDVRASFLVHDGQVDEPGVQLWPWARRLGSLESLTACWTGDRKYFDERTMAERLDWLSDDRKVRQVHLHPRQVPLGGSRHWDYGRLLVDLIPGPEGVEGQIIARDDIDLVFVAPSFGALLDRIATGLEDGTMVLEGEGDERVLGYRKKRGKRLFAAKYFAS